MARPGSWRRLLLPMLLMVVASLHIQHDHALAHQNSKTQDVALLFKTLLGQKKKKKNQKEGLLAKLLGKASKQNALKLKNTEYIFHLKTSLNQEAVLEFMDVEFPNQPGLKHLLDVALKEGLSRTSNSLDVQQVDIVQEGSPLSGLKLKAIATPVGHFILFQPEDKLPSVRWIARDEEDNALCVKMVKGDAEDSVESVLGNFFPTQQGASQNTHMETDKQWVVVNTNPDLVVYRTKEEAEAGDTSKAIAHLDFVDQAPEIDYYDSWEDYAQDSLALAKVVTDIYASFNYTSRPCEKPQVLLQTDAQTGVTQVDSGHGSSVTDEVFEKHAKELESQLHKEHSNRNSRCTAAWVIQAMGNKIVMSGKAAKLEASYVIGYALLTYASQWTRLCPPLE